MDPRVERIIYELLKDMGDRRGLGDELDAISEDEEVYDEMLSTWRSIIARELSSGS